MTEPRLHQLERQFQTAVDAAVDAPRGVEVAQAVQALVLGAAMLVDNTGGDLHRMEARATLTIRVAVLDAAADVRKDQVKLALLGEARRCSRKASDAMGGSGTVRSPASVSGLPNAL